VNHSILPLLLNRILRHLSIEHFLAKMLQINSAKCFKFFLLWKNLAEYASGYHLQRLAAADASLLVFPLQQVLNFLWSITLRKHFSHRLHSLQDGLSVKPVLQVIALLSILASVPVLLS
jgi:hypothetical protein